MICTADIADKLTALAVRGITCGPNADGKLLVQPPSLLLDDDRGWVRDHARETVAHFTAGERWNLATALHLMHQADGAVAESGVNGQRPEVRTVVEVAFDAYAAKNLTRLRLACAALHATVRRLKTST